MLPARTLTASVLALSLLALPAVAAQGQASGPSAHAARATLATFAGQWSGHTRGLTILRSGTAHESIGSGCCDEVIRLDLKLSDPRGTSRRASARVRIVKVRILDAEAYSGSQKAPRVGQVGTLRLRDGVITEPFTKTNYCNKAAGLKGDCGA
jgi:hypothetical protein